MPEIIRTTSLNCSAKELFFYLASPSNWDLKNESGLPMLSMHSSSPILAKGQELFLQLDYGFYRLNWKTRVTKIKLFEFYQDEQIEGPFRKWIHRQYCKPNPNGTDVIDEIEYDIGYGILGRLLDKIMIRYQLDNIIKNRHERATEKFPVLG